MAGGQGLILVMENKARAKQFLPLLSEITMLQQTYYRFRKWLSPEKGYFYFLAYKSLCK